MNRATATVTANLDYLNFALANSDLPIRYVVWGDIQDIGATDEEIGRLNKTVVFNKYVSCSFSLDISFSSSAILYSSVLYPRFFYFDYYFSFLTRFGDTPEGHLRVYQTADIVFLYLNNPLSEHNSQIYGVCKREVIPPDENFDFHHAILMVGNYSKNWLHDFWRI